MPSMFLIGLFFVGEQLFVFLGFVCVCFILFFDRLMAYFA